MSGNTKKLDISGVKGPIYVNALEMAADKLPGAETNIYYATIRQVRSACDSKVLLTPAQQMISVSALRSYQSEYKDVASRNMLDQLTMTRIQYRNN